MNALLLRYFGTTEMAELTPKAIPAASERMLVDLGMETDPGKRFALWSLLYLLDASPELDVVFEEESEREAARNFMDLMAANQPK
ncbi:MAG: hypothetical protein ABJ057_03515 [Erythrobacter sp.]